MKHLLEAQRIAVNNQRHPRIAGEHGVLCERGLYIRYHSLRQPTDIQWHALNTELAGLHMRDIEQCCEQLVEPGRLIDNARDGVLIAVGWGASTCRTTLKELGVAQQGCQRILKLVRCDREKCIAYTYRRLRFSPSGSLSLIEPSPLKRQRTLPRQREQKGVVIRRK